MSQTGRQKGNHNPFINIEGKWATFVVKPSESMTICKFQKSLEPHNRERRRPRLNETRSTRKAFNDHLCSSKNSGVTRTSGRAEPSGSLERS